MLKNITKLEHKIGDRTYQFLCENDAPLGECHDALSEFRNFVITKINEFHEATKKKPEEKTDE